MSFRFIEFYSPPKSLYLTNNGRYNLAKIIEHSTVCNQIELSFTVRNGLRQILLNRYKSNLYVNYGSNYRAILRTLFSMVLL